MRWYLGQNGTHFVKIWPKGESVINETQTILILVRSQQFWAALTSCWLSLRYSFTSCSCYITQWCLCVAYLCSPFNSNCLYNFLFHRSVFTSFIQSTLCVESPANYIHSNLNIIRIISPPVRTLEIWPNLLNPQKRVYAESGRESRIAVLQFSL